MNDRLSRRSRASRLAPSPGTGLSLGLGLAVAVIASACSPVIPTATSSQAPAPVVSVAPSANGPDATGPEPVGQTDTDWGRIWDSLPGTFPTYPGAAPAAEIQTPPVSGTLVVEGIDAKTVVSWIQAELQRTGYATEALNGPLEDGGFVLESSGSAGCRTEVAVAPLGGLTTVTVRYGASCPSP
jgi:hypothetical protein